MGPAGDAQLPGAGLWLALPGPPQPGILGTSASLCGARSGLGAYPCSRWAGAGRGKWTGTAGISHCGVAPASGRRATATGSSYGSAHGEAAGPEPSWVCLGRSDASGSRPSSHPAPPHSTSRNRAWCNPGWPLLRAAGRWGSGHGAPAPSFRASGSLLHQVHCAVQGQLEGAEAPPHPPSWRPAHRRAALPRKHATASCWGHQHGPRDPGLAGGDPSPPERVTPASSSVVCSARRTQHAHKTGNSPPRWRPWPRPHTQASRPWSIPSSPRPGRPCT